MVAVAGILGAATRWEWEQQSGHRNRHVEVVVVVPRWWPSAFVLLHVQREWWCDCHSHRVEAPQTSSVISTSGQRHRRESCQVGGGRRCWLSDGHRQWRWWKLNIVVSSSCCLPHDGGRMSVVSTSRGGGVEWRWNGGDGASSPSGGSAVS